LAQVVGTLALPALAAAGMYACVASCGTLPRQPVGPDSDGNVDCIRAAGYMAISLAVNRSGIREMLDVFSRERAKSS